MILAHPCPIFPAPCDCHECHLYRHDARYRKLWGGNPLEVEVTPLPLKMRQDLIRQVLERNGNACWHLGEPLETAASCGCGGAVKRRCGLFGECRQYGMDPSLPNCSRCESYVPRPDPTVGDWIKRLQNGIIPPSEARHYRPEFTQAIHQVIKDLREDLPPKPQWKHHRGVVTTGGGKYWPGAWVQAAILRDYGWTDPIQAWYLGEAEADPFWQEQLTQLGVETIDARQVRERVPYRILNGFEVKLFAFMNSGIQSPLWLDSDCYPCRHPGLLWDCPEYQRTGSIHWPDLPNANVWTKWERWGVEADTSPPIETGQFIYDLAKTWEEAQIALRLNEFSDLTYHWDYGDKGPARVAWAWTKRARAIYRQIPDWIGPAFSHVAHDGLPVLIHRCRGKANPSGSTFYTPQHSNGQEVCGALPSEDQYQKTLTKARELARQRTRLE